MSILKQAENFKRKVSSSASFDNEVLQWFAEGSPQAYMLKALVLAHTAVTRELEALRGHPLLCFLGSAM